MNTREIFKKNINKLILRTGKQRTDIAGELDIPLTTFVSWTNGVKYPRAEAMSKLANYFSLTTSDLLKDDEESTTILDKDSYETPVFKSVSCGNPTEQTDDVIGYELLPESLRKKGEYFGVRAKGDSMFPKIEDGDILIVHKQKNVNSGDIAIVKVNGDESTCKKIIIRDDGVTLQPLNGSYEALFYTKEQISKKNVEILGKVVESRKKF
ncbi:predicted peptidase S24/S26A/S26B/S26C [Alteracholeplasma palmae J233]|uniref:Predicted peptidase S24/S26A/S26B/S26C n=1 Tax=Alteracholeplasma palmae (strain ATCC 49389 / J233) TaxID=1318466 RepID=U4KJP6_ALTPJ|nr:S24 family peptidase [Alteracholeplasma palmae]CCV63759.1 predicted peptidase S24/S26A/S26B/S26C [Alteracholeplasma palmae J233]